MIGATATVKADEFMNARKVDHTITKYAVYFSHCGQFYQRQKSDGHIAKRGEGLIGRFSNQGLVRIIAWLRSGSEAIFVRPPSSNTCFGNFSFDNLYLLRPLHSHSTGAKNTMMGPKVGSAAAASRTGPLSLVLQDATRDQPRPIFGTVSVLGLSEV